jgi:uncharacterized protein (DUF1501 family)
MAMFASDAPPFVVPEEEKARFQRRLGMLKEMDSGWREHDTQRGRLFHELDQKYQGAYPLLNHPRVSEVFKVAAEDHLRYGSSTVGDACLLARNIVQEDAGCKFILISHGGWDLHKNAYDKAAKVNQYTLCRELDSALSNLLKDLESGVDKQGRSLLDKVFVACLGEFGRTTGDLSTQQGRDHYRMASAAVFAGAGVKGDKVLGSTDGTGANIIDTGWRHKRSIYPEDILVTMYSVMGIDWSKKISQTFSGRSFEYVENISPIGYVDFGEISELFG